MTEVSRSAQQLHTELESIHEYPLAHWQQLSRFIEGEERDLKDLFRLADEIWDAWPYAKSGRPTEASRYRFRFGHLRSFLKPYAKWYCYQRLIGSGKSLTAYAAALPYYLAKADTYLCTHGIESLEELADPAVFAALWESLVKPHDATQGPRPVKAVKTQLSTRAFWEHLRVHFGVPTIIPPNAPHVWRTPAEFAADEQQVIPSPVIRQLMNRLALHRDDKEVLSGYDHLRLCVLILMLCLGRRIDEVLAAPRGEGVDGPLSTYPAKGNPVEEALWFRFHPNKQGPREVVYVSPEWRDVTRYCVRILISYGDEVRNWAHAAEQHLLILISTQNRTSGAWATRLRKNQPDGRENTHFDKKRGERKPEATGLSQAAFVTWLRGARSPEKGALERWRITADGSDDGPIYTLRTHQARHTRQSALAKDPHVPLLTRQRDLNHRHPDMQFAYQHTLREQNQALLEKAKAGLLFGPATSWLTDILHAQYQPPSSGETVSATFQPGHPALLNERWRTLIARSSHFLQLNRVPCGYCTLPQGPEGCMEYMNCLEATDEGCQWFATDPENEEMLVEIQDRVSSQKIAQKNSLEAGHVVQAQKYEVLSRRAESVQEEVLRRSSQDLRERLKARRQELEAGSS
jgi:hypothetical protein